MYNDIIKRLLEKHFGQSNNSLSLNVKSKNKKTYYFELSNKEEISSIAKVLSENYNSFGIKKFPELRQEMITRKWDDFEKTNCAVYHEEDGFWNVSFYTIKGIKYHKTRGNNIAATIVLNGRPYLTLSEKFYDDYFGYWRQVKFRNNKNQLMLKNDLPKEEGFSYWVNKTLFTNTRFRNFTVDFFREIGQIEQLPVFTSISETIYNTNCFLVPISFKQFLLCEKNKI